MTGAINSPGGVDSTYRLGDVGKAKFGEKKPVDSQGSSIPPTINDFLKKMGLPVLSTPVEDRRQIGRASCRERV